MSRFELGMTLNYAGAWGITEAVREFFQNAIDEEHANPENKMYFGWKDDVLTIANKRSSLPLSSLLLGSTSKEGDDNLIGKHGEGYKVATVVLERNGIHVKIYNNEAKEVWTSRIIKSRKYGTDIVGFDVEKKPFKKDYDLVIELEGITEEMYNSIVESNLHLQEDIGEVLTGEFGRVLLDEKYKGKIFVEGLYVCTKDYLGYGYDFKASLIKLDRDRALIDSFDLMYAIAKLVVSTKNIDFIRKNIKKADFNYISAYLSKYDDFDKKLSDAIYEDFVAEYGDLAYPVSTSDEYNSLKEMGANPVMVDSKIKDAIDLVQRDYHIPEFSSEVDKKFSKWLTEAHKWLSDYLYEEIINLWREKGAGVEDEDSEDISAE